MEQISCPACGHAFTSPALPSTPPDPSLVGWFRDDPGWTGELSTDKAYGNYLRAVDSAPVSRAAFVAGLAYLGVEQVLDGDTQMLIRS